MNITPISVATPNFQTAKAVRNVNFTGLAKTAQNIGSAAGEAAANAAKKSGIKDKVTKVLSFAIKGLKNIGKGILGGIKKLFGGNVNINVGKNNVIKNTQSPLEEYNKAVKNFDKSFDRLNETAQKISDAVKASVAEGTVG